MYKQTPLLDYCYNKRLAIINADVRDKALMKKFLETPDAIFPLACLTGAPLCTKDPLGARSINFDAIKYIEETRSKNQVIIFPTTNSGYGLGEKGIFCTEETPLRPISHYGKTKCEAENLVIKYHSYVCFRLATVFGASYRMRTDLLVNNFCFHAVKKKNYKYLSLISEEISSM